MNSVRIDVLVELAVEEEESFAFLGGFEHGVTRTDAGSSHKACNFLDRGDGHGIFGEDSDTIATEIWDQDVFVLGVDDHVMRIARILA